MSCEWCSAHRPENSKLDCAFRFSNSDVHADSLGGSNLFFMRNPGWRYIRAKLTPVFTSGKMKQMFYLMNEIGTEFSKHLSGLKMSDTTRSTCIELKDLCARYTTDVIASCAFGLKAYSIDNPNSEFRENGRGVFHFNWKRAIEFICFFFLPEVASFFRFKIFTVEASKFLRSSIGFAISERERTGQVRNDLIDTLVALKREDENKVMKNKDEPLWQGDTLVAQAAVFFTAGFETSSATISFSLFELAWKVSSECWRPFEDPIEFFCLSAGNSRATTCRDPNSFDQIGGSADL